MYTTFLVVINDTMATRHKKHSIPFLGQYALTNLQISLLDAVAELVEGRPPVRKIKSSISCRFKALTYTI